MPLNQFDYLLAIGTIFAGLDAWNIGESRAHSHVQNAGSNAC